MFIKTSLFKKLLREAYKGTGIRIGHSGKRFYIAGSYWALMVNENHFPKREKAAVVELIGDLPHEEFFRANKEEGRQQLLPEEDWMFRFAEDPESELEETNLLVQEPMGTYCRMLKDQNGNLVPMNQALYDIIDESSKTDDDLDIVGPYRVRGCEWAVFWNNNTSSFMLGQRNWKDNVELMEIKKGLERAIHEGMVPTSNP